MTLLLTGKEWTVAIDQETIDTGFKVISEVCRGVIYCEVPQLAVAKGRLQPLAAYQNWRKIEELECIRSMDELRDI